MAMCPGDPAIAQFEHLVLGVMSARLAQLDEQEADDPAGVVDRDR